MDANDGLKALEERLADLEQQVQVVTAVQAIERLLHQYGYYLDKTLYEEIVQLFARDPEVRFLHGIYRGTEGVERLFLGRFRKRWGGGSNGPAFGHMLDHPMMQHVITVAPDGRSAQGRARVLMMLGVHDSAGHTHEAGVFQRWESALYENEYVMEDGSWRIKKLEIRHAWLCTFESGWAHSPVWTGYDSVCYPENPDGPDEISDEDWRMWPETRVLPFHYPHPVTGEWVKPTTGGPYV
jgi:hypothetical protein